MSKEEGYDIPLDIQVEILKKLPSQSLVKFRSVSKQWKSLIDSRRFILSYGFRHTNRFILSYQYEDPLENYEYLTLTDNDNEDCLTFSNQSFGTLDPPGLVKCSHDYYPHVVGSSHGLLCLGSYFQRGPVGDKNGEIDILVVLWNPSIRRSVGIQLPDRQDWIARFGEFKGLSSLTIIVGFGVCPITMDPTIVYIIYGKSDDRSTRCIALVFTLTSGAWNTILTTNLSHESIISYDPQVVIHRFIYWVAYEEIDEDYRTYKLVSFDLTAKEFRVINLPNDRLTLNPPTISNLRGSLVVLEHYTTPGCPCFLWMMMMDQGVTPSFTRLYTINLPITDLLGFRKTGEPIIRMQVHDDEQDVTLNVYDSHSKQFHRFRSDGNVFSFFMCSYMETLLLLDQSDGYIYSISN